MRRSSPSRSPRLRSPRTRALRLGAVAFLLGATASRAEPPLPAVSLAPPPRADAEQRPAPVDLREPRARAIQVRFEVSPPDAPGRLARAWTEPARAWLAPGPEPGRVGIRVPAHSMEEVLAAYDPVPGSFSDFLWRLDRASGHVLSASFTGTLRRPVDLGLWATRVETDIRVDMDTRRRAGFLPGEHRFGHLFFGHCEPPDAGCTLVEPRPYDPATGYVNAVGAIRARGLGWLRVESFSPLGEALFREAPAADAALSSGTGSAQRP